jgi:hypothetical protein
MELSHFSRIHKTSSSHVLKGWSMMWIVPFLLSSHNSGLISIFFRSACACPWSLVFPSVLSNVPRRLSHTFFLLFITSMEWQTSKSFQYGSSQKIDCIFRMSSSSILLSVLSRSNNTGTVGRWLRPTILDMSGSLQYQTAGEQNTSYQIWPHHSWLKRRSHQPKKI